MTSFLLPSSLPISYEKIAYPIQQIINKTTTNQLTIPAIITLLQTKTAYIAVENQTTPVGIIITNRKTGDIELLTIHPNHQNKGLGKALLLKTITHQHTTLTTYIPNSNPKTIYLFAKQQFIVKNKTSTHTKLALTYQK